MQRETTMTNDGETLSLSLNQFSSVIYITYDLFPILCYVHVGLLLDEEHACKVERGC